MRPARALAIVAAVVACGVVTACGSTSPTSSSGGTASNGTPTAIPGKPVTSGAFSTVVPDGWTDKVGDPKEVQKLAATGKVEYLVEQGPPGQVQQNVNDVTANINVLLLTTPVPDNQIPPYLASVSASGATNLTLPRMFTIDGATGQYITYDRDIQGTPGESQDMIVNRGGNTYDITINTSQFAFNQQKAGLEAVLAAWRWKA